MVTRETLYPYLAGNDIGCGMALFETEIPKGKVKLDRWEKKLGGLKLRGRVTPASGSPSTV